MFIYVDMARQQWDIRTWQTGFQIDRFASMICRIRLGVRPRKCKLALLLSPL